MKVERVKFKSLYGIRIIGDNPVEQDAFRTEFHMQRAAYLATMLESPKWGTVQSYDNAGMSGGPFHFIARYPRTGKQGTLFQLLRRIEMGLGARHSNLDGLSYPEENPRLETLWAALRRVGWYVATDGMLRSLEDGSVVSGNAIRNEFAPVRGVVPAKGPKRKQAEMWATLFHKLLADIDTYPAQIGYCIEWLNAGQTSLELNTYSRVLHRRVEDAAILTQSGLDEEQYEVDLAMCFYHANSVNAPGAAASCLKAARKVLINGGPTPNHTATIAFAKALIKKLATKKYGAWDKRYKRARKHAIESELWPSELFKGKRAIMPLRFG